MSVIGILLAIPWFFIMLALILKLKTFRINGVSNTIITALFTWKIIGAFSLQVLYTFYYSDRSTSDPYRFFDDGLILHDIASESPLDFWKIIFGLYDDLGAYRDLYFDQMNSWIKPFDTLFYNDNIAIIKTNGLLNFLSGGYYEINALIISALVFGSLILLIQTFFEAARMRILALSLVSIFPLWFLMLSGVLKESVLFLGIGLFVPTIVRYADLGKLNMASARAGAFGLFILVSVKPYFIVSLIPALIVYIFWKRMHIQKSPWLGWASIGVIVLASIWILKLNPVEQIARKQRDFINHSAVINPGSEIYITPIENTPKSILVQLPTSLFNVLAEPLPSKAKRPGEWLMLIENMMLWVLIGLAIWLYIKHRTTNDKVHLIIQAILPGLFLIGLISPVLGATIRYRAPFLLLLILAIIPYLQPLISARDE